MKVTFVSNYINHHQIPVSNELYAILSEDYHFVQTEPMEEERLKMGWGQEISKLPYLVCFYEKLELCKKMILESDVVIFGGVEEEAYIKPRLEKGLFTIRYSERIYKEGQWKRVSPRGLIKKYKDHVKYRKSDVYMLCSGGYVADDFSLIGAYPDKMLKWGYFPESYSYNIEELFAKKEKNKVPVLLWTGRMIDWKHPEYALIMADKLAKKGYDFQLKFIGEGEQKEYLKRLTGEYSLEDKVLFMDFMKPSDVRAQMEQADIYLMTSDRKEGWGAVVNEAMNSGCVVVASHMVGATPNLISHQKNGLVFRSDDVQSLADEVEKVINNDSYRKELGTNAYKTIDTMWNPKNAARRLLAFCKEKNMNTYAEGPCAKETPVREYKMYKKLVEK